MRLPFLLSLLGSVCASPLASPEEGFIGSKPVPADAPPKSTPTEKGVGVGVTEIITPTAVTPAQCLRNYNGAFGIAVMRPNVLMGPQPAPPPKPNGGAAKAAAPAEGVHLFPELGAAGGIIQKPDAVMKAAAAEAMPAAAEAKATALAMEFGAANESSVTGKSTTSVTMTKSITNTVRKTVTLKKTVTGMRTTQAQGSAAVFPVSQIGDGQLQGPTSPVMMSVTTLRTPTSTAGAGPTGATPPKQQSTVKPISQIGDGQIQAPPKKAKREEPPAGPDVQLVSCKQNNTLDMLLKDGVLKDSKGRTGYIASNYQFQFDAPPQSGSIYTAGFSICNNGSLALGGTTQWWQCLSGEFNNLYDRNWAEHCQPITINAVMLKDC